MVRAQAMGEYGGAGGGILDRAVEAVSATGNWVATSVTQDRPVWIFGGVCLLIGLWLFRRR